MKLSIGMYPTEPFQDLSIAIKLIEESGFYGIFSGDIPFDLREYGYVDLNLARDGNEYAEVVQCLCAEPWVHAEMDEPDNWE